jgi:acylphosphatase
MGSAPVAFVCRVTGRVQGVGFRRFAEDAARAHSVRGWVRNRADRSVECHAEGAPDDVAAFLAALRRGPPASHVADVRREAAPLERAEGFAVRATV